MSAACCIDNCKVPAFFHIEGYPDDVDLCTEHYWTACDCPDEAFDSEWCPMHGSAAARSRITRIEDNEEDT